MWMYVIVIVICYILGSINNALIISRIKKRDVRHEGSGNPGAMNMFRNYGFTAGALTLFLDAFKGALAVLIGWFLLGERFSFAGDDIGKYVGAISVIVGHVYPIFLKFKGGKGIASTIGICFVLNPVVTAISFAIGVVFIIFAKMGAIASFIIIAYPLAFTALVLVEAGFTAVMPKLIILFAIFFITFIKHRTNMVRLFTGTENKTDIFNRLIAKIRKRKEKKLQKNQDENAA